MPTMTPRRITPGANAAMSALSSPPFSALITTPFVSPVSYPALLRRLLMTPGIIDSAGRLQVSVGLLPH